MLAWLLIGFWIIVLGAIALTIRKDSAGWSLPISKAFFIGLVLSAITTLTLWSRYGYRDLKSIAQRIEDRHPELDQKLMTAVEPAKPGDSEFLRGMLIRETLLHAKRNAWEQIVPGGRLALLWGFQWLLMATVAIIPLLFATKRQYSGNEANSKRILLTDWVIEPGSVEIEKGTDLLVSVRFPEGFTEKIKLNLQNAAGESESIDLQRSLRDPIASATLRRIKQPIRYTIQSESKKSDEFVVDLFEHPSVLQSDANIQSPAYAHQDDKTIANTRRVSIVDGATITWTLKLNKPVASAQWVDEAGQSIELKSTPENPAEYQIPGSPKSSGRYRLKLLDQQGRSEKPRRNSSSK